MKVLNLYAGLGGNRKLWEGVQVTAVEIDEKIAAVYSSLNPSDEIIIGVDAHQYLLDNYNKFDFIWSSPPCQSHSKMVKGTRHQNKKYPDLKLYEEIIFLTHFFKGRWVIENVIPYYKNFIPYTQKIGRHLFWSNFYFHCKDIKRPDDFINIGQEELKKWLGIFYEDSIYYQNNHCPAQVLRNCVHPKIGLDILKTVLKLESNKKLGLI